MPTQIGDNIGSGNAWLHQAIIQTNGDLSPKGHCSSANEETHVELKSITNPTKYYKLLPGCLISDLSCRVLKRKELIINEQLKTFFDIFICSYPWGGLYLNRGGSRISSVT